MKQLDGDHSAPDLEPNRQAMVAGSSLLPLASMHLPLRMNCGQSEAKDLPFFLPTSSVHAPKPALPVTLSLWGMHLLLL